MVQRMEGKGKKVNTSGSRRFIFFFQLKEKNGWQQLSLRDKSSLIGRLPDFFFQLKKRGARRSEIVLKNWCRGIPLWL